MPTAFGAKLYYGAFGVYKEYNWITWIEKLPD